MVLQSEKRAYLHERLEMKVEDVKNESYHFNHLYHSNNDEILPILAPNQIGLL